MCCMAWVATWPSARGRLRSRRFTLKQYLELSHVAVGALDRPLADLGLRRRVALSVPFLVPAVAAVAGSDLVLTLPRKLAKAVAAMANVRFVEPPPEIKSFQYFMVWHPRLTAEPAQVWFRELTSDLIQQSASRHPGPERNLFSSSFPFAP